MSRNGITEALHLPKLSVSGFRGIRELKIERLGRATLLAGRNGIGKTTVLEAVQLFASRGRDPSVWMDVLQRHDEYPTAQGSDSEEDAIKQNLDLGAVFYGRELADASSIRIGPPPKKNQLEVRFRGDWRKRGDGSTSIRREGFPPLFASYRATEYPVPLSFPRRERFWLATQVDTKIEELPDSVDCLSLGSGLLRNKQVARLWDRVVLMGAEEQAVEALKLWGLQRTVDRDQGIAMIAGCGNWLAWHAPRLFIWRGNAHGGRRSRPASLGMGDGYGGCGGHRLPPHDPRH